MTSIDKYLPFEPEQYATQVENDDWVKRHVIFSCIGQGAFGKVFASQHWKFKVPYPIPKPLIDKQQGLYILNLRTKSAKSPEERKATSGMVLHLMTELWCHTTLSRATPYVIDMLGVVFDQNHSNTILRFAEYGPLDQFLVEMHQRSALHRPMSSNTLEFYQTVFYPQLNRDEQMLRNILKMQLVALDELHQRGVVHADFKPENMLVCIRNLSKPKALAELDPNDIVVKLTDFGVSLQLPPYPYRPQTPTLYRQGETRRGTDGYRPMETHDVYPLFDCQRSKDPYPILEEWEKMPLNYFALDIWSLGICAFALLFAPRQRYVESSAPPPPVEEEKMTLSKTKKKRQQSETKSAYREPTVVKAGTVQREKQYALVTLYEMFPDWAGNGLVYLDDMKKDGAKQLSMILSLNLDHVWKGRPLDALKHILLQTDEQLRKNVEHNLWLMAEHLHARLLPVFQQRKHLLRRWIEMTSHCLVLRPSGRATTKELLHDFADLLDSSISLESKESEGYQEEEIPRPLGTRKRVVTSVAIGNADISRLEESSEEEKGKEDDSDEPDDGEDHLQRCLKQFCLDQDKQTLFTATADTKQMPDELADVATTFTASHPWLTNEWLQTIKKSYYFRIWSKPEFFEFRYTAVTYLLSLCVNTRASAHVFFMSVVIFDQFMASTLPFQPMILSEIKDFKRKLNYRVICCFAIASKVFKHDHSDLLLRQTLKNTLAKKDDTMIPESYKREVQMFTFLLQFGAQVPFCPPWQVGTGSYADRTRWNSTSATDQTSPAFFRQHIRPWILLAACVPMFYCISKPVFQELVQVLDQPYVENTWLKIERNAAISDEVRYQQKLGFMVKILEESKFQEYYKKWSRKHLTVKEILK